MALILAALIVYRLATDLAWETGPFGAYARLRGGVMSRWPATWIAEGVTCPICWSMWIALPAGLILSPDAFGMAYWIGIAGAVALMVRVTRHDD